MTLKALSPEAQQLVDEVQSSTKTISEIADICFIPQGVEIPKPESVFTIDGIPVFTKKSISTLIGKAKSGKTTCTAWAMAQAITNQMNVLWIDTEQGAYYSARTQSWVLSIAQLQTSDLLKFYDLKIHDPKTRIEIIEYLITLTNPDIVIIDGVRDLVFDINAPEEATIVTGHLMRWADLNDCHILAIIHQNKGNEHARGHLGTEMINKSETVISVTNDENKITICEPVFTRGEPFKPFAFDRDAYGRPYIVDYQPKISGGESNSRKALPIDIPSETHYQCLNKAFNGDEFMKYSDLLPAVCASFEYFGMAMGVVRGKSFIQFYQQNNYLKSEKNGKNTHYFIKNKEQKTIIKATYEPTIEQDEAPF